MRKEIEEYKEKAVALCSLRGQNPERMISAKEEPDERGFSCGAYREEFFWYSVARELRDFDEMLTILSK